MADNDKKPSLRFKGFTDSWEQRKLGETMETVTDYVAAGSFADLSENVKYLTTPSYAQLIRTTDLKSNFINKDFIYVDKKAFDYLWRVNLNTECIIMPNIGNCGEIYYINPEKLPYKHNVLGPNALYIKSKKQDNKFLSFSFQSDSFQKKLSYIISPNGQTKFNKTELKMLDIIIPNIKEQQKVGQLLYQLDNLITLHQRKYEKLKNIKKASLDRMFPQKDSQIPLIRFKNFTNSWEQRKLGDVANRYDNLRVPITAIDRVHGKVPYYGANGIQDYVEGFTHDGEFVLIAEDGANDFKNYPVQYVNGRIWVNNHAHVLQTMPENSNLFLKYCISISNIEPLLVGGGRAKLNAEALMNLLLLFPKSPEQQKIGQLFQRLDNLITLHQRKLKMMKKLQNYFLKTAFFIKKEQKMTFNDELEFEKALISLLFEKGWEKNVLKYQTEEDLIKNWADILFENNRDIDRLNDQPLTYGEMQQIMEQIKKLRTPLNLNGFINGKTVSITRENPNDPLHFGKEVSLKIYDRQEIAAGQSRYQIAEQPIFNKRSKLLNDRRGDFMLLINGMPVIHVELKKSGIPISQACYQIEKYAHEGVYNGIFSLIQVFVAMNPEETVYFANPGPDGVFNKDYYFHWADVNNEPINDWKSIAEHLLSIPMAHQLIGFYTVADNTDGILKVMRSYQYYAASAISDKVAKTKWGEKNIYGGYIWHTTGSGKTLTSFKSAQLISNSKDADKVLFLMDRIELGTQSLLDYRGFAADNEDVQATENTNVLLSKLKSSDPADTLIVTSIQKMSRIKEEGAYNENDIKAINKKRIVFIIDECHRSTFGEMLAVIKKTFPAAIFFGFTGTPIHDENQRKMNTTYTVFGNELHRYSIADGIRDKNVLGFDPYKVLTFRDKDVRTAVALNLCKATSVEEILADPQKSKLFYKYMNEVPMAGFIANNGEYVKGIEDYLSNSQYEQQILSDGTIKNEHQKAVVKDILENFNTLSHGGKFHAIFATSSIPEAIQYYKLLKNKGLKIAALFDQSIDNSNNAIIKEDAVIEMLADYNTQYGQSFTIPTYQKYKKDIALRLAHKEYYKGIENSPEKQLNILIVVDQMLTGFDSKWINTLYLDKLLRYENIIQAFSRTNRLFGPEKPFGIIRYYRRPHTMERNINAAVKLYSGDKPLGLFVDKLAGNLKKMGSIFADIQDLFSTAGVNNFEKLPDDVESRAKFAFLFKQLNIYLEAVYIQGFSWNNEKHLKIIGFDKKTYLILALRYKELFGKGGIKFDDVPYEIEGYLTEINTGTIDTNYMNFRFKKYLKEIEENGNIEQALNELHKTFATLTQEEQKYAYLFLRDIQRGDIKVDKDKSFRDYITEYQTSAKNDQIHRFAEIFEIDETKLRRFMKANITNKDINAFGKFDELKNSVNKDKAKKYFEKLENKTMPTFKVAIKVDEILRKFILEGGFDVNLPDEI